MEGTLHKPRLQAFMSALHPQFATQPNHIPVKSSLSNGQVIFRCWRSQINHRVLPKNRPLHGNLLKVSGTRRRRANTETDTYVLMEPGKNEEFITEDELRGRLKWWLENWPGQALPPDLAKLDSVDDIVEYLVKSVCELELDGEVGSIQWYQVRLE